MRIDGQTRLAAVVARPIKHSISPYIHNRAFEETGVNGVYVAWDIAEEDLPATLDNIRRYQMFGINLSMPYKEKVIPYLDQLTPSASLIGAVNTVIYEDGRLLGHNTDGIGFFRSLAHQAGFEVRGKSLVILGAGGASQAIIAQAALDGARSIAVFTRPTSLDKARTRLSSLSEQTGVPIQLYSLDQSDRLQDLVAVADLFVNGTSVGMDGQACLVDENFVFPDQLLVADVIYQPFETPFLALARSQGRQTINGLGMLLFQAAEAFACWTGQTMPTDLIWQELSQKYQKD